MPLPIPKENESKEDFIKRFMSDDTMVIEYPDEKQRYAVAESQWGGVDRYKASNYENGCVMLSGELITAIDNEQWIKVFPKGSYYIQKYNRDIIFDNKFYKEIETAYLADSLSKPKIDKDHEFKESYGDILGYNIKDDGMYFNIRLNEKGVELVKSGQYNYVSPAWGMTKDNSKKEYPNRLLSISLVNYPALEGSLQSLKEQIKLSRFDIVEKKQKEVKMDLFILAKELGLNSEASVEAIYTEVKTLKTNLENTAKRADIAESQAIKLGNEVTELKQNELKKEAVESVKNWIVLGKVHPSVQDIVIERYVLNKEATIKEMSLIPENVYSGQKANNNTDKSLSNDIIEKMKRAGLDINNKEDIEVALDRWGGK
jgi:hypothetical protein